jgi:hypothetical protein
MIYIGPILIALFIDYRPQNSISYLYLDFNKNKNSPGVSTKKARSPAASGL